MRDSRDHVGTRSEDTRGGGGGGGFSGSLSHLERTAMTPQRPAYRASAGDDATGGHIPGDPSLRSALRAARASPAPRVAQAVAESLAAAAKTDQVHLSSHALNLTLTAEARRVLARSAAQYPAIAAALVRKCCGRKIPRAVITDFPPVVTCEASRETLMQEAVLAALLSSARAEESLAGPSGAAAVAALGVRFDELGAEAIDCDAVIRPLLGPRPYRGICTTYWGVHCERSPKLVRPK